MLDFKYKVFLSAAKRLSFSKAAKELSLTQPAVSFQIRHLEEEIGTRLFLRYPNRVELTPIGKMLLKETEDINAHALRTQEKIMRRLDRLWGTVVVGASTTIGNYFLPPVLAEYKNISEEVVVKVLVGNTNEILSFLSEGIIDFAIVEGPVKTRQWEVEEAFRDELVVIAPRDFPCMGKGVITKKQLSAQPFISREAGSGTRAVIDSLKDGTKPLIPPSSIALDLGSNTAIKKVVAGGLGVSLVSLMTLESEIELKSLSVLRIKDYPIYRTISFVFKRGEERNMLVNGMIDLCKKRAMELKKKISAEICSPKKQK